MVKHGGLSIFAMVWNRVHSEGYISVKPQHYLVVATRNTQPESVTA